MKTILETNVPITDVLNEAINFCQKTHPDEKFEIVPILDKQKNWLEKHNHTEDLVKFRSFLKSKVSRNIFDINKFLKENGYSIQLKNEINPKTDFAVASLFEILSEWKQEGKSALIDGNSCNYKAFSVRSEDGFYRYNRISTSKVKTNKNPLITTPMKNGDIIQLLEADPFDLELLPLEMYDHIQNNIDKENKTIEIHKLILPELNIDLQPDISFLLGMNFSGTEGSQYAICEAHQQIKFKLNKVGAEVKSAVAISARTGSLCLSPKENIFIFDKPFYVWLSKPETKEPYFAGYISMDSFIQSKE